jgi:hypothetical protein
MNHSRSYLISQFRAKSRLFVSGLGALLVLEYGLVCAALLPVPGCVRVCVVPFQNRAMKRVFPFCNDIDSGQGVLPPKF